jgi:hypothetical protein
MPTNVGRANIGTKIFQGRVETRYGEGLKKSVVNEAGDFSAVVRSILRRHDICEKEPDHDEHQNPSDVHGPPLPRISRPDCSIPQAKVDRLVTGLLLRRGRTLFR